MSAPPKLADLRPGDVVIVRAVLLGIYKAEPRRIIRARAMHARNDERFWLPFSDIMEVEAVLFRAGEKVRAKAGVDGISPGTVGTVKAVCDGYYWVQWIAGGDPGTHTASVLERAGQTS